MTAIRLLGAAGAILVALIGESDDPLVDRWLAIGLIAASAGFSTITSSTALLDSQRLVTVVRLHVGADLGSMFLAVMVADPDGSTGAWVLLLVPIGEAALIASDRRTTIAASVTAMLGMAATMLAADGPSWELLGRWAFLVFLAGGPTSVFLVQAIRVQEALWRANRSRARLHRMATHDDLTDLLNRRGLHERSGDLAPPLALVYLDLDRFKAVNDSLGHEAGDEVLRVVGRRLTETVGDRGDVARLGGDEFAIVVHTATDHAEVERFLADIHGAIERPIPVRGTEVEIGASLGVAVRDRGSNTLLAMIDAADAAMLAEKSRTPDRPDRDHRHADRRSFDTAWC